MAFEDTGAQLEEANVRPGEQRALSTDLSKLPGIFGQIGPYLPALLVGTSAALTSPVRSAPAIAGRAILGGLAGYSSSAPPPMTQKDLYYQERLALAHRQQQELDQKMAITGDWLNSLPKEERGPALLDPKGWRADQLAAKQLAANKAYLSRVAQIDPDKLPNDPKIVARVTGDIMHYDYVNQHRPGSYSVITTIPPGESEPQDFVFDHHAGQTVGGPIGKAPPKAGGKMTEGQAQAALVRLRHMYQQDQRLGNIKMDHPFDAYVKDMGLDIADLQEKAGMKKKDGAPEPKPTETPRLAPGTVVRAPDGSLHRSVDPNATLPPGYTIEK